ncbi:MAG: peroxiredoxin [Bacteroidales bacterium]|nr:peroxiredoxin [Bacteroidales bacterium]
MLKIGDRMPDFEVVDQDGNQVSSKDLIGKKTVVYFYPKDNTSGCTAEACSIRDNYESLVAKGYNVIGALSFIQNYPAFFLSVLTVNILS